MNKKCDHCGFKGHTKVECFKLHGEPQWFKELQKGKGGRRFVGNVAKQNDDFGDDTPLDDDIHDFESGSSTSRKPDARMISTVVKEVMKAFSSNQGGSNS